MIVSVFDQAQQDQFGIKSIPRRHKADLASQKSPRRSIAMRYLERLARAIAPDFG